MALGALFVTVYLLVDAMTPPGAGTRTFAWLVTANNGGIALGAVVGGEVIGTPRRCGGALGRYRLRARRARRDGRRDRRKFACGPGPAFAGRTP